MFKSFNCSFKRKLKALNFKFQKTIGSILVTVSSAQVGQTVYDLAINAKE